VIAAAGLSGVRSTSIVDARLAPSVASMGNYLNGLRETLSEPKTRNEAGREETRGDQRDRRSPAE
jgi:hypothetical protein